MLNNTELLAAKLNQLILVSEEMIAFSHSYQAVMAHPELMEMEKDLKSMQQELLKLKTDPSLDSSALLNEYTVLRERFENHPLVVNYLHDREALVALCHYIQDAWQGQLD